MPGEAADQAQPEISRHARRAYLLGGCAALGLIGLLARGEASQILSDLAVRGITYPANSLYSVLSAGHASAAMQAWALASCSGDPVRAWLWWQLAFDVTVVAAVVSLGVGASARWPVLNIRWLVTALAGPASPGTD